MPSPTVAVAILNWNGLSLLQTYLADVVAHSQPHAVYVIDNDSSDGSVAYLQAHFPDVKCIQTGANLGYAGGYNAGMKHLEEDIVVLLNSDVRTTPGWLEPVVAHLEARPKCGALQPKIRWDRQPERFEYAGAAGGFMDTLGYPFCRGRLVDELEVDRGQYDASTQVFWATGACMVVRREAYNRVGGLDNMLFAHMEEIDLCWRMQRAGYEIWAVPASTVFHLGGATLDASNPKKTFLNFRNNLHILVKNLPQHQAFVVVMARLVLDGLAGIKFLIDGKPRHTWAIVRAHFAFYARFGRIQRQRVHLARKHGLPFLGWRALHGVYHGSMAWAFFAKGKRTFAELTERMRP